MAAVAKRTKNWKDKLPPGKTYPIDEALKLAKKFSSEESAGFLNGILDAALKSIEAGSSGT